jgi:hypothetical protein
LSKARREFLKCPSVSVAKTPYADQHAQCKADNRMPGTRVEFQFVAEESGA